MKRNLTTLITLLLIPQLVFASVSATTMWWIAPLVVTQIFVVVLNFRTKRIMKDKIILIIIYALGMITPWEMFFKGKSNLYLSVIYLFLITTVPLTFKTQSSDLDFHLGF
jgi:hypothetical protein